jgi:hypothetical protein
MGLCTGTPEDVGMCPQRIERLRQTTKGWAPSVHHSALVLLVARRGVVVWHEAYGRQTPAPDANLATIKQTIAGLLTSRQQNKI